MGIIIEDMIVNDGDKVGDGGLGSWSSLETCHVLGRPCAKCFPWIISWNSHHYLMVHYLHFTDAETEGE